MFRVAKVPSGCRGDAQLRCLNLSDSLTSDLTLDSAPAGEAYIRLNKLTEAEHWYRESLRAKPDHIPAHLTYGKLLAMTVRCCHDPSGDPARPQRMKHRTKAQPRQDVLTKTKTRLHLLPVNS